MKRKQISVLVIFMDGINRRIYEFMANGAWLERKTIVDRVLEAVQAEGFSINKSALAQRVGMKKRDYMDGHWVIELRTLARLSRPALETYAVLDYKDKRRWSRVIDLMTDDEVEGFNALKCVREQWRYLGSVTSMSGFKPPRWIEIGNDTIH